MESHVLVRAAGTRLTTGYIKHELLSPTVMCWHQVLSRKAEKIASTQYFPSSNGNHTRTQSEGWREIVNAEAHGAPSISGLTTPQSQFTESADDKPYCPIWLSQSPKASKCPFTPDQLRRITIEARATYFKRLVKHQPWNTSFVCHTEAPERRSISLLGPPRGGPQYKTPPARGKRQINEPQNQLPQKSWLQMVFLRTLLHKEWPPPNESVDNRDGETQESVTL